MSWFRRIFPRRPPPDLGPSVALADARLPPDCRVYAIGDIHGRRDLLVDLLARIDRDADGYGGRRHLVFVGDYVDRGDDSRGVIDVLLRGLPAGFQPVFLRGNHESMLLSFLDAPDSVAGWLAHGGFQTLLSYEVAPPEPPPGNSRLDEVAAALRTAMGPDHLRFMSSLRDWVVFGDYFICHAGVDLDAAPEAQTENDLLWVREPFLDRDTPWRHVVVHGHSPAAEPQIRRNRIGIDTGAYATGRLTALVLQEDGHRFIAT